MTEHTSSDERLDELTAALPREIAPPPDLWPAIRAELAPRSARTVRWTAGWRLAAAGLLIAASSSVLTLLAVRASDGAPTRPSSPRPIAHPRARAAPHPRDCRRTSSWPSAATRAASTRCGVRWTSGAIRSRRPRWPRWSAACASPIRRSPRRARRSSRIRRTACSASSSCRTTSGRSTSCGEPRSSPRARDAFRAPRARDRARGGARGAVATPLQAQRKVTSLTARRPTCRCGCSRPWARCR